MCVDPQFRPPGEQVHGLQFRPGHILLEVKLFVEVDGDLHLSPHHLHLPGQSLHKIFQASARYLHVIRH